MVDPVPHVILLAHPFYEHSQTMSGTGSLFINNGLGKFPNDFRVPIRLTRLTLADMVASGRLPVRINNARPQSSLLQEVQEKTGLW